MHLISKHAAQIQLTLDPYSTCAGFKHGFQVNILGDRPLLHVLEFNGRAASYTLLPI
jgi:hypothetical protein